ncbi:hypothetical protein ACIBCN_42550 [Nocardia sp. NPDC051052]|uniref:hypothetical protein n=1 Tax=Nocardia sp. NPDC051052 TaxID=3364322 RepID=UPI0037ACE862
MGMFEFRVDKQAGQFIQSIVHEMMKIFGISEDEAVKRVNARFCGQAFTGDDIIFHEGEDFWAKDIMYGGESAWWKNEADAKRIPLSDLPRSRFKPCAERPEPDASGKQERRDD